MSIFTSQISRHHLLQKLFWNRPGAALVQRLVVYSRMFDTVVRSYSLIGETNGERWLPTLMPEEPVVIDVGFHDGASTDAILRARPAARVTGFDPSRFARKSYQQRFADDSRVTFVNVGLSSAPGELLLHDYENMCNSLAARKEMVSQIPITYTVPITTLDLYAREHSIERVDYLKIDAEGYDLHVLEGARDLLARGAVDVFVFEFASGWSASKRYLWEACEYIDGLPYSLYRLFNGFLCPLEYETRIDSCCTLPAMYVGVSNERMARGDIPVRPYRF
jgi:FkbM family methyltransferase